MKNLFKIIEGLFVALLLTACAPEVGSDDWCADLKKNPQGDWTVDEVTGYAKHCLLKQLVETSALLSCHDSFGWIIVGNTSSSCWMG